MITDRILRLLFPPKCEACLQPLDWYTCEKDTVLCPSCLARLQSERALTCDQCAKRVDECTCMPSLLSRAGCKGFYKLVKYYPNRNDYVQNRLLYTVKKQRAPRIHFFFAHQLAPAVNLCRQTAGEDSLLLTYLPRNPRSERKSGTDQARMLAEALSIETEIPFKSVFSRKRRGGVAQKKLSRKERIDNAQKVFEIAGEIDLKGTTVILVDDIVTTGSSMAAGVRLLRECGAKNIFCLAVAVDQ